jgi:hypothetical protein
MGSCRLAQSKGFTYECGKLVYKSSIEHIPALADHEVTYRLRKACDCHQSGCSRTRNEMMQARFGPLVPAP